MFCPACGTRNAENATVCAECGAPLPCSSVMRALADVPPTGQSFEREGGGQVRGDSGSNPRRRFEKGRRRVMDTDGAVRNSEAVPRCRSEDLGDIDRALLGERASADAPVQLGCVKLVVEQGRQLGEQFLISEAHLLIGRFDPEAGVCPDIDLSAQDPAFVHRRHARISFDSAARSLTLIDLGGRNGSFVNNRQVPPNSSATLGVGDKIRIGRVVLRLCEAPEMNAGPGS